jgi:5-methylcytosine-specific restriction endonuclease McrA
MGQLTLVLDCGHQVLGVVPWETAISMWVTEKCEVLSEYDDVVRSAYLTINIPAVVRMREAVKKRHKAVKFSRINVYARDGYKCQYCGEHCKTDELTYDHVVPRAQGGKTEWTNIVSACMDCNSYKGGRTPEQAKMKLLKKPVQPKSVPTVTFRITKDTPEAWRDYLHWSEELEP